MYSTPTRYNLGYS